MNNYLVAILIFIIIYDIYLHYFKEEYTNVDSVVKIVDNNKLDLNIDYTKPNDDLNYDELYDTESEAYPEINNKIDENMFGKALKVVPNNYIEWDFYDNKPWSKIIYYYNKEYSYYFYIKVKIPSLNDYENWKNVIINIEFDPRTGEIILPTKDEISALVIADFMVLNFLGKISLDEIIKGDLIGKSILKAKTSASVKEQIKERLINNVVNKNTKKITDIRDIKNQQPTFDDDDGSFNAYDGLEFSFI